MSVIKDYLQRYINNSVWTVEFFGLVAAAGVGTKVGFNLFYNETSFYDIVLTNLAPICLACVTIVWYFRYRNAVSNELDQIESIFDESKLPNSIRFLKRHGLIVVLGASLGLSFLLLALFSSNITIYCAIALILCCSDLLGWSTVLQNLTYFLSKKRYEKKGADRDYVAKRRYVIESYYFENPVLQRSCIILITTAVALVLSYGLGPVSYSIWPKTAHTYLYYAIYTIVIVNFVCGEIVIFRWRNRRERDLDLIERARDEHG